MKRFHQNSFLVQILENNYLKDLLHLFRNIISMKRIIYLDQKVNKQIIASAADPHQIKKIQKLLFN